MKTHESSAQGFPPAHPLPPQLSRMGVYVHVPFCPHICPYCDFVKTSRFSRAGVEAFFVRAAAQAAELLPRFVDFARATSAPGMGGMGGTDGMGGIPDTRPWSTLYFGGGTPGLFPAKAFAPLVEVVARLLRVEEFTIETNPYTNSGIRFREYAELGIDRVTLGAQSLCPDTLRFLGRKHSPEDVLRSLSAAREAGIGQVQVDLIYGLADGIRGISLREEVARLAAAGATGISAYALTIEERTPFGRSAGPRADDDRAADEYAELLEACAAAGFRQVESSNFSSQEAKHNNIYWYGLPFLGLGTGAHGLLPPAPGEPFGNRYRVGISPTERAPGDDDLRYEDEAALESLFTLEPEESRTGQAYLDEMIFTLLRTPDGLPGDWLSANATPASLQALRQDARLARGLNEGLLTWDAQGLRLAAREKIRGDAWCALIASLLQVKE
jgi:oxygen-independent coproporphyrinogen-3 oxidase